MKAGERVWRSEGKAYGNDEARSLNGSISHCCHS